VSLAAALRVRGRFLVTAAAIVALDQATKLAVETWLRARGTVEVVPGWFDLSYARNAGGLFGMFREWPEPWRLVLLTLLPIGAVALITLFLLRTSPAERLTLWGLAAILGGACGNLIDRLLRGEVIDFLDAHAPPGSRLADWLVEHAGTAHWHTFNVADSAIVVGAGLLVAEMFVARRAPQASPPDPREASASGERNG
jgi:signal peptidase II